MTRWLKLLGAAVVIAALVVALILVRNSGDREEPTETVIADPSFEPVKILDIPRESITAVEITREDNTLLLQANADGTFTPEYEYDVRFVNSRINRVVGSVTSLSSRRVIDEEPEDLSVYGLDSPGITVAVSRGDLDPASLFVGNRTPSRDAFYVQVAGDQRVYSVTTAWVSPFFYALDDLRDKTVPQINPQALQQITINNLDGRTIEAGLIPEYENDPELVLSSFAITEPYARRYSASTTWLEELSEILPSIAIVRFEDDDPRDLSAYGLDPPMARFRISDDQSRLDLTIGASVDGGRFARFGDEGSVFVVAGVDEIVSVTPYETISTFSFIISIDLVDRIDIETPDGSHVALLQRAPGASEEDDPVETFVYDGEEIHEDIFRDLYQWLIGLLVDGETSGAATGPAELAITYQLNTGQPPVRVEYVPQDSTYYAVYRDGVSEFVVARSKIQRLYAVLEDPSLLAE